MESRIIMGCMRINNMDKKELNRLIHRALDLGINVFDHADIYGGGSCESFFGEAIATMI